MLITTLGIHRELSKILHQIYQFAVRLMPLYCSELGRKYGTQRVLIILQ